MKCERTETTKSLRPKTFQSPSATPKRLEPPYTGLFTSTQLESILTLFQEDHGSNLDQDAHSAYRSYSSFYSARQINVGIES